MARKTLKISPNEIKSLRNSVGLTQKQAADSVHISLRQWQKFEESESSSTFVRIPDATLELFCLKEGLPFPPNSQKLTRLGNTISFAGGPGGIGRSTLTRDIAILLSQEDYEVLIVTDRHSHLINEETSFIATNTAFPRTLATEDINWDNKPFSDLTLDKIKNNYDFIFFDLEKSQEHLNIMKYQLDLVIVPTNPTHHMSTSISNIIDFKNELSSVNTLVACLLIGLSNDFSFNFSYHGCDFWMTQEGLDISRKELTKARKHQEEKLREISKLQKLGVYVFESYSSDIYKHYESLLFEEKGFWSTGYHFLDNPNTLSAYQMRAIKSELLRIFKINANKVI
ncbi:hypothetical protein [Vibrio europaeus]|uniref:hypothetical protein n=1 Tax=Vibrio europaeus TaxID=300876 RepID=UPI00233F43CE|nr:hypothetical protein [Vibrio europaeus]MDC5854881.1 hypothetical protein [Vibrio europaeus]